MASTSNSWTCKLCQADNQAKGKACRNCRASRTYADAVMAKPPAAAQHQHGHGQHAYQFPHRNPANGNALQQQLADVVRLMEGRSGPHPPTPSQTALAPKDGAERQTLVKQLQQLEASLNHLPDSPEFMDIRAHINAQHAQAKAKLASTRPLGARLDGCKAALERTRHRAATCLAAESAAQFARAEAQAQVVQLESELAELESMVSDDVTKQESTTCLTRLQAEMMRVVTEMAQSSHVDKPEVDAVMASMTSLFQGVTSIAARCQASATAAPPTPGAQSLLPPIPMEDDGDLPPAAIDPQAQKRLLSMLQANSVAAVGGA
jgi:hypothetical protein